MDGRVKEGKAVVNIYQIQAHSSTIFSLDPREYIATGYKPICQFKVKLRNRKDGNYILIYPN